MTLLALAIGPVGKSLDGALSTSMISKDAVYGHQVPIKKKKKKKSLDGARIDLEFNSYHLQFYQKRKDKKIDVSRLLL